MDETAWDPLDVNMDEEDALDIVEPSISMNEILSLPSSRGIIKSYEQIPEPIAIIDNSPSLAYLYKNPTFRALLDRYKLGGLSSLAGTVWKQVDKKTIDEIRTALHDLSGGFAWKGEIELKSHDALTAQLKAHIFPLWPDGDERAAAPAFSLYLDDITEERRQFQRMYLGSLLEASLQKDNDTGKHVQRVNHYLKRLAEAIFHDPRWPQVDLDYIDDIGYLAAMHDVGKIGISERIIYKPGPLTEEEWQEMREHPITGALILASYPKRMAQEIARSHHERWNGTGYPYNLMETAIPLSARIVMIADVYDALRMKRSYKPAFTHEIAVEKIAGDSGTHFDPSLMEVFHRIAEDFRTIFDSNAD
ncbi:MAG: HD domain-containing phosphohydrolase [Spirochaetota bacterium]